MTMRRKPPPLRPGKTSPKRSPVILSMPRVEVLVMLPCAPTYLQNCAGRPTADPAPNRRRPV